MKPLRKFFMEDDLENNRFQKKYNLGESGGKSRTVSDILLNSGLSQDSILNIFLNMKLCDSPNWGRADLRDIVASLHPGATRNNVLITTGTSEALFLLFRYLNPKSVAMAMPAFQLLYEIPLSLQSKLICLPVRWNSFGVPFVDEEEWIKILKKTKPSCFVLNNPHNPSGLIFSTQFLNQLSQVCHEIKCTFIGDEHYRFLSHPTKIVGDTVYKKNSFVTGSFIKCIGVPGLRIGWCVGPEKALSHMQNEKNYTTHTVNPITEWISYEVLKNLNSALFQNMKEEWVSNKQSLNSFLNFSKTIIGTVPEGGLVTSLQFKNATSLKQTHFYLQKLLDENIFVLPLKSMEFGKFEFQKEKTYKNEKLSLIQKGFGFRLGLGCDTKTFKEALYSIEKALS